VVDFYRTKMPDYGWVLEGETPLEESGSEQMSEYELAEACPTCAKAGITSIKPVQILFADLAFSNKRGDQCKVGFSRVVQEGGESEALHYTSIMVDYVAKQK